MSDGARWLLLIHQIPPTPAYLRVKIGRRLQHVGAVAIKSSIYALPNSDESREDFQWIMREIVHEGGEASICAASFVDGLTDTAVVDLFNEARGADYAALAEDVRELMPRRGKKRLDMRARQSLETHVIRLRKKLDELAAIDFFAAGGRERVFGLIAEIERLLAPEPEPGRVAEASEDRPAKATWVTRRDVHVDRIASAWLIRRFIDRAARFKFIDAKTYQHRKGELRFDMVDAEYTHEGDACTFEVLLARFGLTSDPALRAIGEVIHDLDIKDGRYGREETVGVKRFLDGLALSVNDDDARLASGGAFFDALHASLGKETRQ